MGYGEINFQLYRYTPNIPAAVVFIILFTATTAYHLYQLTRARAWYFIAFVIGGICEIIPLMLIEGETRHRLVFFTFFVITSAIFHWRIRRQKTAIVHQLEGSNMNKSSYRSWESVLWGLYIASALILIRSIFRLVEYARGNSGYLISHEVFLYVFDSTLMFLAMVTMNVFHPSGILTVGRGRGRQSAISIGSSSQTELENSG